MLLSGVKCLEAAYVHCQIVPGWQTSCTATLELPWQTLMCPTSKAGASNAGGHIWDFGFFKTCMALVSLMRATLLVPVAYLQACR